MRREANDRNNASERQIWMWVCVTAREERRREEGRERKRMMRCSFDLVHASVRAGCCSHTVVVLRIRSSLERDSDSLGLSGLLCLDLVEPQIELIVVDVELS